MGTFRKRPNYLGFASVLCLRKNRYWYNGYNPPILCIELLRSNRHQSDVRRSHHQNAVILPSRRGMFNFNRSIQVAEILLYNLTLRLSSMDSLPVTNKTAGDPESLKNKTLETGAAAVQVCSHDDNLLEIVLMAHRTLNLCNASALTSTPFMLTIMIPAATPSKPITTARI